MDVTSALFTFVVTVSALAPMNPQEAVPVALLSAPAVSIACTPAEPSAPCVTAVDELTSLSRVSTRAPSPARPKALVPLYASFAVLQGLDIYTTSTSHSRGAREGNAVMRPVAGKTIASAAVKAAATAGSIYFIERAWKQHRKGAVILMTAINVATAAVVAHNTRVAKQR